MTVFTILLTLYVDYTSDRTIRPR